jgi:hypothetical protein
MPDVHTINIPSIIKMRLPFSSDRRYIQTRPEAIPSLSEIDSKGVRSMERWDELT